MTRSPVVALHGIQVARAGRSVLDIPELAVDAGQVLAVIGPNGAGKSTLLRVMGLLEPATAGRVSFQGERVSPADGLAVRRRMASVFQEPLLADTTVRDNVALGLRFRGLADRRAGPRVEASRQARTLSGGEAQRTALARALVLEPELLLLDEPFSALDQPTREALLDDFARILRQERTTTVLVTHDRAEAMTLGDRVGVLMGGRLVQLDDAAQVFRAPASEEVARFVGVETILDGRVVEWTQDLALVDIGGQMVEVAQRAEPGERVRLCVRPEDVTIFPGGPKPGGTREFNRLGGRVQRLVASGPHVRVVIDCGFPLVALVTQRSVEEWGFVAGSPVTAHFKATAPHLLRHAKP
jgi:ABC-type sulfate/molybdate transport systems ATPase subunit